MKSTALAGLLSLLVFYLTVPIYGQVNIAGKPGLLYIPTARLLEDGTFSVSYTYNPIRYAVKFNTDYIRSYGKNNASINSESVFCANLTILPRFDLNINILRPNGYVPLPARGVGDRQVDLRYVALTERRYRPSLALIVSTPFGFDNSLVTTAVAATKNWPVTRRLTLEVTAGFGSPYYVDRGGGGNTFDIFSNYKVHNKDSLSAPYLSGPFGGVVLRINNKGGLMVEWDSRHLNMGAYTTLFKHWTVQAGVLNFDQVTVGTAYTWSLRRLPGRFDARLKELSAPGSETH